jgi:hypothetical protein
VKFAALEVHILPTKLDELGNPKSGAERDNEEGVPLGLEVQDGREERSGLVCRDELELFLRVRFLDHLDVGAFSSSPCSTKPSSALNARRMELTPPGLHLAKSSAVKSATVIAETAVARKSRAFG